MERQKDPTTKRRGRVKFSMRIEPDCFDDELLFAKQLGFDCVYCWLRDDQTDLPSILRIREKIESFGLEYATTANYTLAKCRDIQLNLPGRDKMIDKYLSFVEDLGKAGIKTTTLTWEPVFTRFWDLPGEYTTRGALTRRVDLKDVQSRPILAGREYSKEEIWENYEYFIKAAVPAAERSKVRLSLHPNDPPIEKAGGVPFLIHSSDCYKKALAVCESPYLGIEFCAGCWLEGGADFGNITEDFEYFAQREKVFVVHFRNVSCPLPAFDETFLDNGYYNMFRFAKTVAQSGYNESIILDHNPVTAESFGRGSATAYNLGYMRALFERAYDEGETG